MYVCMYVAKAYLKCYVIACPKREPQMSRTTQCNKNSVTDAEQQTRQRRIQFMYPPCDLLKYKIKGYRAWRVIGGWRPLSRQNWQFVCSGEVCI